MNEFSLINKYLKNLSIKNPNALNLSDDIFFDYSKRLAISIDTYVHGIHFIDSNPKNFLKKILRASLSDLYCKGIKPQSYFLSLALNKISFKDSWFKKFKTILSKEQKKFNICLSGGDTIFSSKLTITIVVIGYSKSNPVLRSGVNLNDDIYVTGNIGDSFLGLNILKKKNNFRSFNKYFKKKYLEPDLAIDVSPHLYKFATSSIDVSDGLCQDLKHLCKVKKFGALVELNHLPVSNYAKKLIKKKKIFLKNIFSQGDDYQILFTSDRKNRHKIYSLSKNLHSKISRIGSIIKGNDIVFNYNGAKFKLDHKKMGYIHKF